jgi:hypothetical protein
MEVREMKSKVVTMLSVAGALGLLLCLPLAAQDAPQQQPAGEQEMEPAPAEPVEPVEPVEEATTPAAEPAGEYEYVAGETPEEPSAADEISGEAASETSEAEVDEQVPERIPKTASPLALVALMGAASIAGGLGLRRWRRS